MSCDRTRVRKKRGCKGDLCPLGGLYFYETGKVKTFLNPVNSS